MLVSLRGLNKGGFVTGMLRWMLRSKRKERDGEDELDTGEVEPASGVVVLDGKSTGSRFGEEMDDLDVSKECVFSHKEGIMHGSVE